jgi:deferrochelatase/peroxidase EfeB
MSRADPSFVGTRRGFLTGAAGAAGLAAAVAAPVAAQSRAAGTPASSMRAGVFPFHGPRQRGIAEDQQANIQFAAFDVTAETRADLAALMRAWTDVAARLTAGLPVGEGAPDPAMPVADSGEAADLPASRLTLTFGLGASLFEADDGKDRFGLKARRPAAFVDLPKFPGDQLVPARTGGDLCVQACADDPQVAFHAVRQLAKAAGGAASLRWIQSGFVSGAAPGASPRNLMGFKDGTINVNTADPAEMARHVWVGDEAEPWMQGGTYMVARPTRIALEHWDKMKLAFQEQTIGRLKASGAPIGGKHESDPLDLDAVDADGNPLIAENAHARLAAPQTNEGAQILRRGYSYDNGLSFVAERWPPWRQGLELDAGLLFICFQRDPSAGFIRIFQKMSRFDMLNQFVTPIGGGLYAVPAGVQPGRYLAQGLIEA